MSTACIQFKDVSKTFDMRLLYKDVNATLYPADIVLLTGNNGTGKSTLLKMAVELIAPSKGNIYCHVPKEKCAYLGHGTFIYPEMTAFENLNFWTSAVRGKKAHESEIMHVLKRVNLDKFAHDAAKIFSRGMAQRLNIARVLLQEPSLLLLDEPSTGLDGESKSIFYACVEEFATKQACILWVSHDAVADSHYATRRMHIEKQRVSFE